MLFSEKYKLFNCVLVLEIWNVKRSTSLLMLVLVYISDWLIIQQWLRKWRMGKFHLCKNPFPHNVIDTRSKTYLCCRRGLTCMIHWGCEDKFFHVNLMLCTSPAVSLDLQMEWWETWNLSFYHQKVDFSPHAFHKLLFLLELGIIDERRMVGMQNTVE